VRRQPPDHPSGVWCRAPGHVPAAQQSGRVVRPTEQVRRGGTAVSRKPSTSPGRPSRRNTRKSPAILSNFGACRTGTRRFRGAEPLVPGRPKHSPAGLRCGPSPYGHLLLQLGGPARGPRGTCGSCTAPPPSRANHPPLLGPDVFRPVGTATTTDDQRAANLSGQLRGRRRAKPPETITAYQEVLAWKGAVFGFQALSRIGREAPETQDLLRQLQSVSSRLATVALGVPDSRQQAAWARRVSELTDERERLERQLVRSAAKRSGKSGTAHE